MSLAGKGMMIWQLPRCEDGSPEKIAQTAKQAGLTHVIIKVANGMLAYNVDRSNNQDLVPAVAEALKSKGIQVWGWHYIYGHNPIGEARIAIQRVKQLHLDGYVIDAEIEYKQRGMDKKAEQFMSAIRGPMSNIPIALSSYRYPKYHPELPWQQFLQYCDYNMPQVYWEQAHTPASQLERSFEQFRVIAPNRKFVPTGAFYKTNGWLPTPKDIQEFLRKSAELGCNAVNFYTWDHKKFLVDQWNAMASFNWDKREVTQSFGQRMVALLNGGNPAFVSRFFSDTAIHVTSNKTIHGIESIQSQYERLFGIERPGAEYTLLSEHSDDSAYTIQWCAAIGDKEIRGRDSFGLKDEKIIYQFSQIL
jgi:hypothetical protein